jgi:hypothetical protein
MEPWVFGSMEMKPNAWAMPALEKQAWKGGYEWKQQWMVVPQEEY